MMKIDMIICILHQMQLYEMLLRKFPNAKCITGKFQNILTRMHAIIFYSQRKRKNVRNKEIIILKIESKCRKKILFHFIFFFYFFQS